MHPSDKVARATLRMPEDVKAFLAQAARRNLTSQNAELVRSVRERMEREKKTSGEHAGA